MTNHDQLVTDTLVIGSGPGGAVTGSVVAKSGRGVIMVEEGEHLSPETPPHFSREELLLKYRNAGVSVALGRNKLAWVEGRCVGGGSEINRGLYHRAPDELLDTWHRDYKVDDLSPEGMVPHFEACEELARVEHVPGRPSKMSRKLYEGAHAKGWSAIEALRLYRYYADGSGGEKQSMSGTFVPEFVDAGGRLLSSVRIDRLRRENGRWIAIGSRQDAKGARTPITITAPAVVVACGAVQTPVLLRCSGVRYNIGNTLRFHPMVKVVAEFDQDINRPGDFDPVHQIKEFEPHLGMGCSISAPPMLGVALTGRQDQWSLVNDRWRRMGIYYVQSGGGLATVRKLPGFRDPLVRISFSPADLELLARGLRHLAEALFAAGAVRIYPCVGGYPDLNSIDDLARLPRSLVAADGSLTSVHIFSSCPMGEDRDRTATNSFGKVHCTDGLYINDASLLCTPTMVNPQGIVMAIAHRNAIEALERGFR
jgi:choline dehydrogenase-like flavoprotein